MTAIKCKKMVVALKQVVYAYAFQWSVFIIHMPDILYLFAHLSYIIYIMLTLKIMLFTSCPCQSIICDTVTFLI